MTEAVRLACANGVDWLQIRERELAGADLLEWAHDLGRAAQDGARSAHRRVEIVVNRRLDVAWAIGADGVHLGFDAVAPGAARTLIGSQARLGVSTHDVDEVDQAARDGADYVHLAPIYAPLSKAGGRPALGPGALAEAARQPIRILAQGGVTAARTPELLAHGAGGVAVTGAILQATDPGAATRRLRAALDAASPV